MGAAISTRWKLTLHLQDESLHPANWVEVMRLLGVAESGELSAEGDGGDLAIMEFNTAHAAVWYVSPDRKTFRPWFPNRPADEQDIEKFYCPCCGIQLGSDDELLQRCMTRSEGVRLFAELLRRGSLPPCVPEDRPDQPLLPGFEEFVAHLAKFQVVEWRPFDPMSRDIV